MRTPEGQEKHELRKALDAAGVYYFMPVQTGYGRSTLDFLCCLGGWFVALETKRDGKEPTARQQRVMKEVIGSGGKAYWGTAAVILGHLYAERLLPRPGS